MPPMSRTSPTSCATSSPAADVSLLFAEFDDLYLVIMRLDQGEDLRVFGSDTAFAASPGSARCCWATSRRRSPGSTWRRSSPRPTDRPRTPTASRWCRTRRRRSRTAEPAGDADLLADLGVPARRLLELCAQEGMLPRGHHGRALPGDRLRGRGGGAARGLALQGPEVAMSERLRRYEAMMRRALAGGERGRRRRGDVPVGAVVYDPDGVELADGRNERERAATRPPTRRSSRCGGPRRRAASGAWTAAPSW